MWLCGDGLMRVVVVEISVADRVVWEGRVAAKTVQRRDWQRAKIVLLAAEGCPHPKFRWLLV